jgi:hypothetical protein
MKTLINIAAGLMIITSIGANNYSENNPTSGIDISQMTTYKSSATYGINVYHASTGSGYGSSMNLNFSAQKFNRVFALGVLFDTQLGKIKGFEFMYKHFLGYHSANFSKRTIKTFFNYNFMYRMPTQIIVNPSYFKSDNINPAAVNGKMTTFEHAIGLGARVSLIKQVYVEGTLGFGVYLGSHYKGATPNTLGIHKDNYGFVPSFKLGFGFQF